MASTIKLGEAATFVNGYPFKPETWTETGLPIIRIQNLNNPEAPYNHYSGPIPEKYVVRQGDILISWSASLGAYEWKGEDAYLNQHIFKVVFDKCPIDKHFLRYAVESKLAEMEKDAHGATMRHIVKKDFDNTLIPYPSIAEQETIVAELDCLTGIIDKKKQQLEELDKLAQSIFYDMFGTSLEEKGFPVKMMGEIGTFQRGAGLQKKDFVDDGMPCIHYGQIHTAFGSYTTKHLTTIPKDLYAISKIGHPGDLLMVLTSEDVEGSCKSTAWLGEYDVAVGSDAAIFSNHCQNAIYLSYCTRTRSFFNEKSKYANGFKVTHIKTGDIGKIPVAIPPRALQDLFAQKVQVIERQKELVKRSIVETETLFNSRMDYWFN